MKGVFWLNAGWISLVASMLSGCQSSRLSAWFPPAAIHRAVPAIVPASTDTIVESTALPPLVPDQSVLTAAASTEKDSEALIVSHVRIQLVDKSLNGLADQQTLPDTISTKQNPRPTPDEMREADEANTFFHTIGVVFLVISAVLIILAFSGGGLAALAYGILALIISIPFLIFESTKSTNYIIRKEAHAARKANKGKSR